MGENNSQSSAREATAASVPTKRRSRRRARQYSGRSIGLVVVLLSCAGGWYHLDRPRRIFNTAASMIDQNPAKAAVLLEEAVGLADGDYPAAQLLWTRSLLRSGRWQEAIGCFSLIKSPSSLDGDELFRLGEEAEAANIPLLSINASEAIPADHPRHAAAMDRSFRVKFRGGRWLSAIKLAERLRASDLPLGAEATLIVAISYERIGNYRKALDAYGRYLEFEEDRPEAHRRQALSSLFRLFVKLGDISQSRHWLGKLKTETGLSSLDTSIRVSEAKLLRLEGDMDSAEKLVNDVLKSEPTHIGAVNQRGILSMERGNWKVAEQDFRKVLKTEPWNKQIQYKLAQVLQRQGRDSEAEIHFQKNRELTRISQRILDLQSVRHEESEELPRLRELADAYEKLGRSDIANRYRRQFDLLQ